MMNIEDSYFKECYLKRMNKDGSTIQERVKTRKEKEFDNLFLKKTKYQALIFQVNDDEQAEIVCSVEPSKWTQDKIVSNIMCSKSARRFKTGDILRIFQKVKDEEYDKYWLIVMVSDDITHGYQAYEAVELEDTINHTDEYGDTLHTIPCKFVSETSVFIQDKFTSYGAISYRENLQHRKFLTRDYDFLKKTLYFDYKGKGWEIVGIDNVSIDGVACVSVSEYLRNPPEPKTSQDILVGDDDNFFLNALK